jgi:hypothetical protein
VASDPLRERDSAPVDADEGGRLELAIAFDDLVGDAGDRPVEGLSVQEDFARFDLRSHRQLLSGLTGPG